MNNQLLEIAALCTSPPWAFQAAKLHVSGVRVHQIAERLGVPPARVQATFKRIRASSIAPAPLPRTPGLTPWLDTVETICAAHGYTLAEVQGRNRERPLVAARAEVVEYLTYVRKWSSPRVGEFLNRDHTSILWLLGRLQKPGRRNIRAVSV
jgi:hypothetical protein